MSLLGTVLINEISFVYWDMVSESAKPLMIH